MDEYDYICDAHITIVYHDYCTITINTCKCIAIKQPCWKMWHHQHSIGSSYSYWCGFRSRPWDWQHDSEVVREMQKGICTLPVHILITLVTKFTFSLCNNFGINLWSMIYSDVIWCRYVWLYHVVCWIICWCVCCWYNE